MILMVAPGPNMSFGAQPSGAAYVSDDVGLVKILNDSAADQVSLRSAGCFTLSPFGGWGNFSFHTLADLYAADTGAIIPGIVGYPRYVTATVFDDGILDNIGTWYKTGTGNGAGNWTQQDGAPISAFARGTGYVTTRQDPAGGVLPLYVGNAQPGAPTSAPAWQILKLTYDAFGNPIAKLWANGSAEFTMIWDERASYSYS